MTTDKQELTSIYAKRFADTADYRNRVWTVLAPWLSRFFPAPCTRVLDLGCGYGEWINNLAADERHAIDLNSASRERLARDVVFHEQDCSRPWPVTPGSLDAIVTSNFFEHLPDKAALRDTLRHAHAALRPGGRLIAMGPNIRHLHGRYWDFIDHHVALSDASIAEALRLAGFEVTYSRAKFMPYSMVGGPSYPLALVRLYLAIPAAWSVLGRQFLVVAEKPAAP